ncbi:MAG: helix-turn-helix transcriptional regulator [Kofleriaceae bacterium]
MSDRLSHGEFFGTREMTRQLAGFALSISSADPHRSVERHTHDDAHFILLLDGHYLSTARGAGHLHAEPALIYNPPGTTHQDTFPERCGRFVGISISQPELVPEGGAFRIWDPVALDLAHRLAHATAHDAPDLAFEALCLELVGCFSHARHDRSPPAWLATVRELLHDRACDEPTMREVADHAGVHPVYLARAFRRYFGCTPAAYVRRCRVERAAVLVRTTALPLAEIAATCGFVDQSHFTRAFAKSLATSPGAYRRRYA